MWTWPDHIQALRSREVPGELDAPLVLGALGLAALGLVMVASSSMAFVDGSAAGPLQQAIKHLVFLGLGLGLAIIVLTTPLAWLERHSRALLMLGFLLLLAVLVPGLGRTVNGATRWLNLGFMGFQVVEAVKLIVIIYLASYAVRFSIQLRTSLFGMLKPLGVVGLIVVLLLAQPDFGSAVLLLAIAGGMVFVAGARLRDIFLLAAAGIPLLFVVAIAEPYRVERLKSFLDPFADPFNDGFQLTQALIAIGRGEWFGVGLGASVQKLLYLPMADTDFILAVIAEELGFAGVALVLALFALVTWRAFRIGSDAIRHGLPFGGYCAIGVGLSISVQALVSVGVNLGVLPTKGLTLPMISAGGSSLLMTCAGIALVLRVGWELAQRIEIESTGQPLAASDLAVLAAAVRGDDDAVGPRDQVAPGVGIQSRPGRIEPSLGLDTAWANRGTRA
jgi:cell division protein FtsW